MKTCSVRTYNLRPSLLRLSQWEPGFNPYAHKQFHVHVWIRLMDLP